MSRSRSISTEISTDERLGPLGEENPLCVLLYTLAIPHADDWGRLKGDATAFRYEVAPFLLIPATQIDAALESIAAAGLWVRYEVGGRKFIAFPRDTWFKHQNYIGAEKRTYDGSKLPAPPGEIWESWDSRPSNRRNSQGLPQIPANPRESPQNPSSPSPSPSPSPSLTYTHTPLPPDGDDAGECGILEEDHYPDSTEPESDPFTPEELAPIHLPAPSNAERTSLARQQRERREQAEALITAFAQEIGGADAPVTAGFIKANLSAAFSLLSANATPESLCRAVRVQREQWPGQKSLTMAYIEQHWPQLSRVTPSAPTPDEDSPEARAKRERLEQGKRAMEAYYADREARRLEKLQNSGYIGAIGATA